MSSQAIETGLSKDATSIHRALASLQEELEAVDYYHQRADLEVDPELKAVLTHNENDELEHAAMLLEWLRRALPPLDLQLGKILYATGSITAAAAAKAVPIPGAGLGLGNLQTAKNNEVQS